MATIVLRAKHPQDVVSEELEPLATEIRRELEHLEPGCEVRVEADTDEHRVGVTFIEVVNMTVDGLTYLAPAAPILVPLTKAVCSWLQRRSKAKADHRPRSVNIFGPDGRVVRRVDLDGNAVEPRIVDLDKH